VDNTTSFGFSQVHVYVTAVSETNGAVVAYVQDGHGRIYSPIPLANRWGSGLQPQAGEQWMIVLDNGLWTFKSRVASLSSGVAAQVVAAVGTTPSVGAQMTQLAFWAAVTTDAGGNFSVAFPNGFGFAQGYTPVLGTATAGMIVAANLPASTLTTVAGTAISHGTTGFAVVSLTVMVSALGT
jgi:hypothetical protein